MENEFELSSVDNELAERIAFSMQPRDLDPGIHSIYDDGGDGFTLQPGIIYKVRSEESTNSFGIYGDPS